MHSTEPTSIMRRLITKREYCRVSLHTIKTTLSLRSPVQNKLMPTCNADSLWWRQRHLMRKRHNVFAIWPHSRDFQNDDMPATGPRSLRASAISFGMIVTRFVWIAHRLVSSNRCTCNAADSVTTGCQWPLDSQIHMQCCKCLLAEISPVYPQQLLAAPEALQQSNEKVR